MGWGQPFKPTGMSAYDRELLRDALTFYVLNGQRTAETLSGVSNGDDERSRAIRRIARAEEMLKEL